MKKWTCHSCGREMTDEEYREYQRKYQRDLELLASDIRDIRGLDPITAIELARKELRNELSGNCAGVQENRPHKG